MGGGVGEKEGEGEKEREGREREWRRGGQERARKTRMRKEQKRGG